MTAPQGGGLYVLDLLDADLDQISDLALVGFMHVTNTLATVLRISAIGVLELTAGLPGLSTVYPVEKDAAVSLEHCTAPPQNDNQ